MNISSRRNSPSASKCTSMQPEQTSWPIPNEPHRDRARGVYTHTSTYKYVNTQNRTAAWAEVGGRLIKIHKTSTLLLLLGKQAAQQAHLLINSALQQSAAMIARQTFINNNQQQQFGGCGGGAAAPCRDYWIFPVRAAKSTERESPGCFFISLCVREWSERYDSALHKTRAKT